MVDGVNPEWLCRVRWQHAQASGGRKFRWGRLDEDYIAEWERLLVVRTDEGGLVKAWSAEPSADRALVEKIRHGEAAAFVRALRGSLSLHASAIAVGHGAILISGCSGAGKSTIAWHLCRSFDGSLLADDVAAIASGGDRLSVEPSEGASWLIDGRGLKVAEPMRVTGEPTNLGLFVSLAFDDDLQGIETRAIHGAEAVSHWLEAVLRFEPSPALWKNEFDVLDRLVRSVPMIKVTRPRSVSPAETAQAIFTLRASRCADTGDAK